MVNCCSWECGIADGRGSGQALVCYSVMFLYGSVYIDIVIGFLLSVKILISLKCKASTNEHDLLERIFLWILKVDVWN